MITHFYKVSLLVTLMSIPFNQVTQAAVFQANGMHIATTPKSLQPYQLSVAHKNKLTAKKKRIREIYHTVNNNLKHYKLTEFENQNKNTEGGFVRLYTHINGQENELKKVEEVYFGETGKKVYEYYFDDNKLYFIFEQSVIYNAPIYYTVPSPEGIVFDSSKSTVAEDRYYFYNGKMIDWLDKNKNRVASNSSQFIDKQNELLEQSIF